MGKSVFNGGSCFLRMKSIWFYSDQTADLEEVIKQADEKKIFNKYSIEWKKIIHILFPFVDKISMGKEYFLSENDVPDSYRSICKKDYIDAYFSTDAIFGGCSGEVV